MNHVNQYRPRYPHYQFIIESMEKGLVYNADEIRYLMNRFKAGNYSNWARYQVNSFLRALKKKNVIQQVSDKNKIPVEYRINPDYLKELK